MSLGDFIVSAEGRIHASTVNNQRRNDTPHHPTKRKEKKMTAHSGQIPAFGKGVLPPNMAEAEGFLDEVDDVSRLIEGLHSGKLSADYVDKRIKEKDEYEKEVVVKEKKKEEDAEAKKYENLPEEKKLEVKVKVSE